MTKNSGVFSKIFIVSIVLLLSSNSMSWAAKDNNLAWLSLLLGDKQSFTSVLRKEVILIDEKSKTIIVGISKNNTETRQIVLSEELAKLVQNGSLLMLPPGIDERFPLGLAGRIVALHSDPNGTLSADFEKVNFADIFEESSSKLNNIPLTADNFVGVIAPSSVKASSKAPIIAKSLIGTKHYSFRNGAIIIRSQTDEYSTTQMLAKDLGDQVTEDTVLLNIEIDLKDLGIDNDGSFLIGGSLDNLTITNEHDFALSRGTDALKSLDIHLDGDLNFEVKIEGDILKPIELGYFDDAWLEVEEAALDKFGVDIELEGLEADDKLGKFPIAGLVWAPPCPTTCPVKPGSADLAITQAQSLGVIVWVYLNLKGELTLDGTLSLARLNPAAISVGIKKPEGGDFEIINSVERKASEGRLIEIAKLNGELGLGLMAGVSVDLDFFSAGIRFANAGLDIGAKAQLTLDGTLGYGTDSLGSPWSWEGNACFTSSIGAGVIARGNVAFGIEIDTVIGDVDGDFLYGIQFPTDEQMSEAGWHGGWYTVKGANECWPKPQVTSVDTSISNGIAMITVHGENLPDDMKAIESDRCTNIVRQSGLVTEVIFKCNGATPGVYHFTFSSLSATNIEYSSANGLTYVDPSICDNNHLQLCSNFDNCTGVGGYWYGSMCNLEQPRNVTTLTGQVWMDRNLGASGVADPFSWNNEEAYGNLYQWGRGPDGHEKRTSATTSSRSDSDTPGHDDFIIAAETDWRTSRNNDLWQGVSGTNNPCPSGYRLPTYTELDMERSSWDSNGAWGAVNSLLRLDVPGWRSSESGIINDDGIQGSYWSSTVEDGYSRYLYLANSDAYDGSDASMGSSSRAYGYSVRCILDAGSAPTCDAIHLDLCDDASLCEGLGGEWFDSSCHSDSASCSSTQLDLCTTESTCTTVAGYWYGSRCNSEDTQPVTSLTGQIWMDRNLGASSVAISVTDSNAYGDLYQWGRKADGHEKRDSEISTVKTDVPVHGEFISVDSGDWRITTDAALWQDASSANNPCPSGYRVPTDTELSTEMADWDSADGAGAFNSALKLVVAGGRPHNDNGGIYGYGLIGIHGLYWSSTASGSNSRLLTFTTQDGGDPASITDYYRASGYSVRCIQDGSPTCDDANLNLCTTDEACVGVSGYWYNDTCNADPSPTGCDATFLTLCATEADCNGANGHWYNSICNAEEEQTDVGTVTSEYSRLVWMDRNLGATAPAETDPANAEAFGDLYQWGRGTDGHEKRDSSTRAIKSNGDEPGHGDFISTSDSVGDWRESVNNDLWQGGSGINNPCPSGFRLPTYVEWNTEKKSWMPANGVGGFTAAKFVLAGYRARKTGTVSDESTNGYYWSSSLNGSNAKMVTFTRNGGVGNGEATRSNGLSVRCILDAPADCHNGDLDYCDNETSCSVMGGYWYNDTCNQEEQPAAAGALNDTGITWGGNYPSGNNADCTGIEIGAQDCSHGRDATHNDDADGHAGFSFTKISSTGQELSAGAADWSCVKDNVTGLIWEVKTDNGGLHDKDDRYNWYNTDPATNGGAVGYADADGNTCFGYESGDSSTFCNTQAYIDRVNNEGWCGASDWRMPVVKELESIVSFDRVNPSIDIEYFPNTGSSNFWSGSPYASGSYNAWYVNFYYGYSYSNNRNYSRQVRLVRGGQ